MSRMPISSAESECLRPYCVITAAATDPHRNQAQSDPKAPINIPHQMGNTRQLPRA